MQKSLVIILTRRINSFYSPFCLSFSDTELIGHLFPQPVVPLAVLFTGNLPVLGDGVVGDAIVEGEIIEGIDLVAEMFPEIPEDANVRPLLRYDDLALGGTKQYHLVIYGGEKFVSKNVSRIPLIKR